MEMYNVHRHHSVTDQSVDLLSYFLDLFFRDIVALARMSAILMISSDKITIKSRKRFDYKILNK